MSRRYAFLTLFVSCVSQTLPKETSDDHLDTNNDAEDDSEGGADGSDDDYEEDELRITESSLPLLSYRELQLACKEIGEPAGGKGILLRKRLLEHLRGKRGDESAQAPAAVARQRQNHEQCRPNPSSNSNMTSRGRTIAKPSRFLEGA